MPRAIDGTRRKERRKKIQKLAKGYWGRRKNLFRTTKDAVAKALLYAYRDRHSKKRMMRRLWITRISAAVRAQGMTYSQFIALMKSHNINMDRKQLSNLAIEDYETFVKIVEAVKQPALQN